jgi:uncharacterized C2H2 Zn-finger protein
MKTDVKAVACPRCGYCWIPRKAVIRVCAKCHNPLDKAPVYAKHKSAP